MNVDALSEVTSLQPAKVDRSLTQLTSLSTEHCKHAGIDIIGCLVYIPLYLSECHH